MIPFFREAGAGPGVVCLHANASTSSQWRALMDRLAWPADRSIRLRDEAAPYEPTLFALLDAESPPPNEADGIRAAVAGAKAALETGDTATAAQYFIDYRMGPGTWADTPASRQSSIASSMLNVHGWESALFGESTPLEAFAALTVSSSGAGSSRSHRAREPRTHGPAHPPRRRQRGDLSFPRARLTRA